VQSRSKEDVIDRFFSWAEEAVCRDVSISEEEDKLDHVFEHVESFVCRGDDTPPPKETVKGDHMALHRDNSLLEACNSVSSKFKARKQHAPSLKPVGEKGDILDYCFDQVETYACGEGATGDLDLLPKSRSGIRLTSSASSIADVGGEDEIHLYYRPNRRG
jgi:hypothetical protein